MALVRLTSQNTEMYVDEKRVPAYLTRGYERAPAEKAQKAKKAKKSEEEANASSLEGLGVVELREIAKARGIDGADALRKAELIEILGA